MIVVCPRTGDGPRPETRSALDATTWEWAGADVSASDDAYWRLLAGLWRDGASSGFLSVAVVEHDIIVTQEALDSLAGCDADWCACPYPYLRGDLYAGLGCTRFRAALMARHPGLLDVVATMSDAGHGPKHWCRLDGWMSQVLASRGERQCRDHPVVGHLGRAPAHGCAS